MNVMLDAVGPYQTSYLFFFFNITVISRLLVMKKKCLYIKSTFMFVTFGIALERYVNN